MPTDGRAPSLRRPSNATMKSSSLFRHALRALLVLRRYYVRGLMSGAVR